VRGAELETVREKRDRFDSAALDALKEGVLSDSLTLRLLIEARTSGKKRRRFRRLVARTTVITSVYSSLYPTMTIADAREWGRGLNASIEAGVDPREAIPEQKIRCRQRDHRVSRRLQAHPRATRPRALRRRS